MALEIPKEETKSIAKLKALSNASLERFVTVLNAAAPISDPDEMAASVAKQLPSMPIDALAAMLQSLYKLYQIREISGVEPSRFLRDFIDAARTNEQLKINPKELVRFESIMKRLMDIEPLKIVAKAFRLQRDGERLFCTAKVLSDIRPVFSEDPTSAPRGAVLTHTLNLGYHEGRGHREFHVILDSRDLEELSDVIARAQAKDKTLRETLKGFHLPALDE
jgi:hypothetical protein